eukprot:1992480-Rhodomonas_salina.1
MQRWHTAQQNTPLHIIGAHCTRDSGPLEMVVRCLRSRAVRAWQCGTCRSSAVRTTRKARAEGRRRVLSARVTAANPISSAIANGGHSSSCLPSSPP